MSELAITFDPPLPPVGAIEPPPNLEGVDVEAITAGYALEHDVLYSIDRRVFAYYPAPILIVLGDLHSEWTLIQQRKSHDVTLSGYTVLEAIFERDRFQFRGPAWPPTPVGERFDAAALEDKFRAATAAAWGLVCSIQDPT